MTESLEKTTPPRTSIAELRQRVRGLPANKRLDEILSCPDVRRVVRGLPIQDLYATVREVGPGDCLELIELLHPRQVQGFLDLDGWRHDRIDSVAMGEWLEVLFAADPLRATAQMRGLDVELLTLLLKIHTRVYDMVEEEEPEGEVGLHTITPDNRFLVVFDETSGNAKLIQGLKQTIDLLFGRDPRYIMRLITAVRFEVPSSLEEEAFRWRNARLADLGFPEPTEAHAVYAWLDPDAAPQGLDPAPPPVDEEDPEESSSNLSTSVLLPWSLLDDGTTVLGGALAQLPDGEARERVTHEIMLCANHVHLADGGDLGDPGALRDTVKKVGDVVGIALSYLAKGDEAQVPGLLAGRPVRDLFRRGHSLGLRLRRELKVLMEDDRSGLVGGALLRLDAPLREVVAGLLRKRPLFFEGLIQPERVEFRHFGSLPEVAETARALSEAGFRAALLGAHGLGATDAALGDIDAAVTPPMGVLLGTSMVRMLIAGADALAVGGPLSDDEAKAAFALLTGDAGERTFAAGDRDKAIAAVVALGERAAPMAGAKTAAEAAARARAYAEVVVRAMELELGAITGAPEPRFFTTVWTQAAIDDPPQKGESEFQV